MPSYKSLSDSRRIRTDIVPDDAPITLQRIVRRRLFRPLMTVEMGARKLRMDAGSDTTKDVCSAASAAARLEIDADPAQLEFLGSEEDVQRETDEQTRAILRQLGDFNRMLLGR